MIRELWPFIGLLILSLAFMVVFPETVLWLPRQFGYKG
jgi:TRAP-type transport system large permease protein